MKSHKIKRNLSLLSAAVFVLLCAASCAGGKDTTNKTTEAISEETTEGVSEIIADGILIVGTGMDAAPFTYADENTYPAGFDIAMVNLIGARLGVDCVIEPADKNEPVSSMGKYIEVVISALPIDDANDSVDFSKAYYTSKQAVLVAASNKDITSAKALDGKNVGVRPGQEVSLTQQKITAKTKAYGDSTAAVKDLVDGKLDAVIADKAVAAALVKDNAKTVKIASGVKIADVGYGIALPKGDTALANAINGAIDAIIADTQGGAYNSIIKQFLV